jgi:hypothetical protein
MVSMPGRAQNQDGPTDLPSVLMWLRFVLRVFSYVDLKYQSGTSVFNTEIHLSVRMSEVACRNVKISIISCRNDGRRQKNFAAQFALTYNEHCLVWRLPVIECLYFWRGQEMKLVVSGEEPVPMPHCPQKNLTYTGPGQNADLHTDINKAFR